MRKPWLGCWSRRTVNVADEVRRAGSDSCSTLGLAACPGRGAGRGAGLHGQANPTSDTQKRYGQGAAPQLRSPGYPLATHRHPVQLVVAKSKQSGRARPAGCPMCLSLDLPPGAGCWRGRAAAAVAGGGALELVAAGCRRAGRCSTTGRGRARWACGPGVLRARPFGIGEFLLPRPSPLGRLHHRWPPGTGRAPPCRHRRAARVPGQLLARLTRTSCPRRVARCTWDGRPLPRWR